jgi:hypothetical protein
MRTHFRVLLGTLLLSGSLVAQAAEGGGPFDYRFGLWGGAFFAEVDTSMRWDTSTIPGTEIGLESNLGMDDNATAFNGELEWRFFNRNALKLRYFDLTRDGSSDAPFSLIVNGITIPLAARVDSFFDAEVLALSYSFAFIKRDNLMIDVGLGLSIQDLSFGIAAEDVDLAERGDVSAPLPTITLGLDWAITPRWIASIDLGYFDLKIDNVSGQVSEFRGGITWKAWESVGFELAYNYFDVGAKVTSEEGDFEGKLNYDFKGPMLGIVAVF